MIDELAGLLAHFGEEAGQTCCFLHVINLVVKTLIRLFDLPRGKGKAGTQNMDDELRKLAEDIDFEDFQTRTENGDGQDNRDNVEEWVNEVELLTEEEQAELEWHLRPLRLILTKVSLCKISYQMNKSLTFVFCDHRSESCHTRLSS